MAEKCPCETYVKSCCACVSMHCDECHGHSKFVQGRFCSNCGRPLKAELTRLYVPKSEVDEVNAEWAEAYKKLEYTLVGVMHSVDKWLEGEELEQDEVGRAITMREKTLQIVENAKAEVAREIFEEMMNYFHRMVHISKRLTSKNMPNSKRNTREKSK